MENKTYPLIFVHGLFGWGEGSELENRYHYWGFSGAERDLLAHLRRQGCEAYAPSNGPISAAWDRACELWAILCGGRVDYGAAHAKRYGHARYGRVYPGLLPDWGSPGGHEKIHLLAHSFGAAAARLFVSLLAFGDEAERAATPAGELSPLFAGGHGGWVMSLTTLSGVNNGTTFADLLGVRLMNAVAGAVYGAAALFGDTPLSRLYDPDADQWGLTHGAGAAGRRLSLPEKLERVRAYNKNAVDHIGHEMQVPVMRLLNSRFRPDPAVYYFACRACRTHETRRGNQLPNRDMRKILKVWSTLIGRYRPQKLLPFGVDGSWLPSDGIVNVRGLGAPLGQPAAPCPASAAECRPGVWYELPVEDKHHMSWVGVGEERETFFAYYDALCRRLAALPSQNEP